VYSSRTLGEQVTSRNQEHFRCFAVVKELLGDRPLVLDREFTYEELMEVLNLEHIQFVIRLNVGDQRKQPRLIDADGDRSSCSSNQRKPLFAQMCITWARSR
jgi:hypothetical protein